MEETTYHIYAKDRVLYYNLSIKIEKKFWEVKVSQIGFQNYKKIFGIPIWEIKKRDTFNKEKLINEILSVKENNESPPREYDNDPNRGFHNQGYETPPGLYWRVC